MGLVSLPLPQAEVLLDAHFIPEVEAIMWLQQLTDSISWQQESIQLFGKKVPQPRLTAWYGEPGATYRYSGLVLEPLSWTTELLALRQRVEQATGTSFNSVLLNLYRSGHDSMGWHADDEPELGPEPVIASVSLGSTRRFRLRPKPGGEPVHEPLSLDLPAGSLLVMRGATQRCWQHSVPKTSRPAAPRINLTFRRII